MRSVYITRIYVSGMENKSLVKIWMMLIENQLRPCHSEVGRISSRDVYWDLFVDK